MPNDDYATPSRGSLKLKGVERSSKISKPHNKRRKDKQRKRTDEEKEAIHLEATGDEALQNRNINEAPEIPGKKHDRSPEVTTAASADNEAQLEEEEEDNDEEIRRYKTEAEIRHEERRKKRVNDSLFFFHATARIRLSSFHFTFPSSGISFSVLTHPTRLSTILISREVLPDL